MEPERFLAELGWDTESRKTPVAVATPTALSSAHYCSFCWCVLPEGTLTCAECGQSVADMEAERLARVEQDRAWSPSRLRTQAAGSPGPSKQCAGRLFRAAGAVHAAAAAEELSEPAPGLVVTPATRGVVVPWKHVVLAITGGAVCGGAAVAGAVVMLHTFNAPAGAAGGLLVQSPRLTKLEPARLTWRNPVPELRLELVSSSGTVVADSLRPAARSLEPGEYRLRVADTSGRWAPAEDRVVVAPGETFVAAPSPRVVAGYYLWAGKKLYEEHKLERAERVWTRAVQAYPEGIDARLQLAALQAVRYRYGAAREQLREVLRREPTNAEGLRLSATLDELERPR